MFEDWKEDVKKANDLLHPAGFFMSHDELRCVNQCASCRAMNMTAGELLAWNVRKAAAIIRSRSCSSICSRRGPRDLAAEVRQLVGADVLKGLLVEGSGFGGTGWFELSG